MIVRGGVRLPPLPGGGGSASEERRDPRPHARASWCWTPAKGRRFTPKPNRTRLRLPCSPVGGGWPAYGRASSLIVSSARSCSAKVKLIPSPGMWACASMIRRLASMSAARGPGRGERCAGPPPTTPRRRFPHRRRRSTWLRGRCRGRLSPGRRRGSTTSVPRTPRRRVGHQPPPCPSEHGGTRSAHPWGERTARARVGAGGYGDAPAFLRRERERFAASAAGQVVEDFFGRPNQLVGV